MSAYRMFEGFMVPADELPKALHRRLKDRNRIDILAGICRHHRVVVEGGANWGAWPARLAEIFETVHAIEPEPRNFELLVANTRHLPNVRFYHAALGDEPGAVGIQTTVGKSGTAHVDGAGDIPIMRLDDLKLPVLDLLILDVEGYEIRALRGARETIARCRPVLLVEDKGWTARYGDGPRGSTVAFAKKLGYQVSAALAKGKDFIMVPA